MGSSPAFRGEAGAELVLAAAAKTGGLAGGCGVDGSDVVFGVRRRGPEAVAAGG